jgi:cytochrome P450
MNEMNNKSLPDWDPHSDTVTTDQLAAYDEMRNRCPVAFSERHQWSLFRHDEIMRVLHDHDTFSNVVSQHLSVPNGMDPPQHTAYRKLIESFFSFDAMTAFEPVCRSLASTLVKSLPRNRSVEVVSTFAQTFALQVQCAFLGWPFSMQELLRQWSRKNHEAILKQERDKLSDIAAEFSTYIRELLQARRDSGEQAPRDVTTALLHSEIDGRPLTDEEIVSILRNWTAGEIGTIAGAVSILLQFLAEHPELQQELRKQPEKLPEAIDETLRIYGPLISNRRRATRSVTVGGRAINAGEKLSLFWVSANRDEQVFEDAELFRWGRDQNKNLLYGAGIHVCPGAPLARLELRVLMEEVLAGTKDITLIGAAPTRAVFPAGGFSQLHIQFQ